MSSKQKRRAPEIFSGALLFAFSCVIARVILCLKELRVDMDNEIKEVYALALNCIIVAMVLALAMLGIHTRNEFAAARNNQTSRERAYQQYVNVEVYQDSILTGDEVISIIRDFYDEEGMEIYLDRDSAGDELNITKTLARQNPDLVDIEELRNKILPDFTYSVWLVYDFYDIQDFINLPDDAKRTTPRTAGNVTGIVLLRQ